MALDVTVGGPNADSWATLAEALTYHVGHPKEDVWLEVESDAKREGLLKMAVRIIEGWARAWTGAAATDTQALTWPRTGMYNRNGFLIGSNVIPTNLKYAQIELARQLAEADRTEDSSLLGGVSEVQAGPVDIKFRDPEEGQRLALQRREALEAMIPDAVVSLLVASWLKDVRDEDAAYNGFVFESLGEDSSEGCEE